MMDECENEAIISGLSKDIFTGVFSLDELTSYCNTYASSMMNNQPYTLDTSAMEQKLSENIQAYVSENNLAVDGDINEMSSVILLQPLSHIIKQQSSFLILIRLLPCSGCLINY